MDKNKYIIGGEIYSSLDTNELLLLLNKHGISSSLGDSSHYHNNTYISIEEGTTIFLENWEREYTIVGESFSCDQIYQSAKKVSDILALLDISHAFEIYADSSKLKKLELIHYLHHNCPDLAEGSD